MNVTDVRPRLEELRNGATFASRHATPSARRRALLDALAVLVEEPGAAEARLRRLAER